MNEPRKLRWKGLVLAGGRSSRMGSDKASLIWRGETLLQRAARTLGEVIGEENVLVSGEGKAPGAIADRVPGLGPIGGIAAAAFSPQVGSDCWFLVLPVDMPILGTAPLADIVDGAEKSSLVGCRALHFKEFELPFAFHCNETSKQLLERLCAPLDPRMRSIASFLESLNAVSLPMGAYSKQCFRNVNFQQEWQELSHERAL